MKNEPAQAMIKCQLLNISDDTHGTGVVACRVMRLTSCAVFYVHVEPVALIELF